MLHCLMNLHIGVPLPYSSLYMHVIAYYLCTVIAPVYDALIQMPTQMLIKHR